MFSLCGHKCLPALVAVLVILASEAATAGGGWVAEPGRGGVRIGFNWKRQPGSWRRSTKGELYKSLFSTTHDYRFSYLSGEIGILPGLEASLLVTYLSAAETVDSTSEEPSHFFRGLSDMWVGAKYQLLSGEYPVALAAVVRLPYLYEGSSVRNGQPLTEVPGLLKRDYELHAYVSHSFTDNLYASVMTGFRLREGAAANQVLYNLEVGYTLPILEDRISLKGVLDGMGSVSEPDPSNSTDRFSGLTLERDTHMFDFNNSSYLRPSLGLAVRVLDPLHVSVGYGYIVWGHSTIVYEDLLAQISYSF